MNVGTLALGANNVLANGTQVVVNGGTLALTTRTDTVAGVQLLSGSITGTSGVLTSATDFDLQSGTVTGILGGAVALNKSTGGTVLLSGANTYTGATNVNDGTLRLGAANRIADTSTVTVGNPAIFDLNNFSETVGSVAGGGAITLGSGTLTSGGNGASTTYSGAISGTGGLTKTGAGVLTLSGANTYAGVTTVNGGTLRASGGNAIGDASQVTLANTAGVSLDLANDEAIGNLSGGGTTGGRITLNGGTLTVNETGTTTYSGVASGAGGLVKQGAGALTLAGINTFTGPLTINSGTVALSGGAALVDTGAISLNSGPLQVNTAETIGRLNGAGGTTLTLGAGLTFGDALDATIASTIGGAGTFTKRGTGTVVVAGANSYAGATNINAGTLVAANSTALGTTAAGTTVANGAQLQIAGVNVGAEAVTLNGVGPTGVGSLTGTGTASLAGAITLATDSTIGVPNPGNSLTLNGAVNGARALTQAGPGTVTFAGPVGNSTALDIVHERRHHHDQRRPPPDRRYTSLQWRAGDRTRHHAADDERSHHRERTSQRRFRHAYVHCRYRCGFDAEPAERLRHRRSHRRRFGEFRRCKRVVVRQRERRFAARADVERRHHAERHRCRERYRRCDRARVGRQLLQQRRSFCAECAERTLAGLVHEPDHRQSRWARVRVQAVQRELRRYLARRSRQRFPLLGGPGRSTPTLIGSVTRAYDGTTNAALLPANYAVAGTIDGDTVALNTPLGGTFDDRNVGTSKNVSATGVSIASATNGGAVVYGYQLSGNSANANIGTITPAALTIAATTNSKFYDGTVSAAATPTVTGLLGGDSVASLTEAYADRNVGNGKTLSVATYVINDGNGGNNYTVALINDLTGVIAPAALIGSIAASDKVYDGNVAATITEPRAYRGRRRRRCVLTSAAGRRSRTATSVRPSPLPETV